jgi:corrinoid protein of di/trimethylamine methyltransferase
MPVPTFEQMRDAVVAGDIELARSLGKAATESGVDLLAAVERGFAAGIQEVGRLWEEGEYFLPELVQGAEAMKAAMTHINPALSKARGGHAAKGKVVIGTVQGDLHDIGKTLVGTLLEANGFEVHDLGADVPVAAFVGKAREIGAHIIGASALLTTTMAVQREIVERVRAEGMAGKLQVLIGGSPTTPAWAESIGAAFAENAQRAVAVAEKLVS